MNTISVKLTFTDDEFYDWFVEPHKVNGELPNLVIRLLTAYANNSELAYQIDQYLDKENKPEAFEVREAIMQAITQLNSLEATANQELEALDNDPDNLEDEDDIVVTPANTGEQVDTGARVANTGNKALEVPPTMPALGTTNTEFESKMFSALDTLTSQISQLTNAVTQIVATPPQVIYPQGQMMYPQAMGQTMGQTMGQNGQVMGQMPYMQYPQGQMMPMQGQTIGQMQGQMQGQAGQMMPNQAQAAQNQAQTAPVQAQTLTQGITPVGNPNFPTPEQTPQNGNPSNFAQNAPNLSLSPVGGNPIPPDNTTPLNGDLGANTATVENPVENVENSDDYSVPDFMSEMIDSCLE